MIGRRRWFAGVSLVTLVPGLATVATLSGPLAGATDAAPAAKPMRIECKVPRELRLRRFEDGSAQLLCGRRVIVRISVPG